MKKTKRGRNPDRFLVRTAKEKQLCKSGIPYYCWDPDIKTLRFSSVQCDKTKLSSTAQRQWLTALIKQPPRRPPLVIISSTPTQNGALYLATFIAMSFMGRGKNVAFIDSAEPVPFFEGFPHCLVLHNVRNDATPERLQTLGDTLNKFKYATKIVAVSQATNPYKWCLDKLHKYPDIVFKVGDKKE